MKTPGFWYQPPSLLSLLLLPLSFAYRFGAALRVAFASPRTPVIPTLCIGNVVAGGGGKTPVAAYVGQWCKTNNINAAFISRGYGGTISTPTRVEEHHAASDVGDEPKLLARTLPTIVGNDRNAAIGIAVAQGATWVILDDGFQNPTIPKTYSILVLKGKNPLGNGRIIPAGPLREPLADALMRASAVIWVDSEGATLPIEKPLFRATSCLIIPPFITRVVAFAGIARPELFVSALRKQGVEICNFHIFPDHHAYAPAELNRLIAEATAKKATLVTTEKDWVRLTPTAQAQVIAIPQKLAFDNAETFHAWLLGNINR